MVLNWEGPIKAESFLDEANPDARRGVYIWICTTEDDIWIEYVGKATGSPNLGHRQQQHVANILGLRSTIPGIFRRSGKAWTPNQYPVNKKDLLDLDVHMALLMESKTYLDSISIYVAEVPKEAEVDLKHVERNLLYDLSPRGTTSGTKTAPQQKLALKHRNATWATKCNVVVDFS